MLVHGTFLHRPHPPRCFSPSPPGAVLLNRWEHDEMAGSLLHGAAGGGDGDGGRRLSRVPASNLQQQRYKSSDGLSQSSRSTGDLAQRGSSSMSAGDLSRRNSRSAENLSRTAAGGGGGSGKGNGNDGPVGTEEGPEGSSSSIAPGGTAADEVRNGHSRRGRRPDSWGVPLHG